MYDPRQRLIVALDVSTAAAARQIVAAVGDSVSFFKVGMQLYTAEGPQIVMDRGADTAVVLSIEEFRRLAAAQTSFVDHLLGGPKLDDEAVELIDDRSPDKGRDIDL